MTDREQLKTAIARALDAGVDVDAVLDEIRAKRGVVVGEPARVLMREEGIEAVSRAWAAHANFDLDRESPVIRRMVIDETAGIIDGTDRDFVTDRVEFTLAHARSLVTTGACPDLADCEALRAPGTDKPAVAGEEQSNG